MKLHPAKTKAAMFGFLALLTQWIPAYAGNHTAQGPLQVGAWRESLVNLDGTINPDQYRAIANSYNQLAAIDYRYGPKFSDFHQGATNSAGTLRQLGASGWYPSPWNYAGATDWFAMSGQLLYSPDAASDPGLARARNGSYYSTGIRAILRSSRSIYAGFGQLLQLQSRPGFKSLALESLSSDSGCRKRQSSLHQRDARRGDLPEWLGSDAGNRE